MKFYPWPLICVCRIILLAFTVLMLAISIKFLCIGHNFKKGPIPSGCRRKTVDVIYKTAATLVLFFAGMSTKTVIHDTDYSHYLGEDYKENYRPIKKTSTIVCNHISWLDCVIMILHGKPAFAPDAAFRKIPIFNTTIECLDSIYIERSGDQS